MRNLSCESHLNKKILFRSLIVQQDRGSIASNNDSLTLAQVIFDYLFVSYHSVTSHFGDSSRQPPPQPQTARFYEAQSLQNLPVRPSFEIEEFFYKLVHLLDLQRRRNRVRVKHYFCALDNLCLVFIPPKQKLQLDLYVSSQPLLKVINWEPGGVKLSLVLLVVTLRQQMAHVDFHSAYELILDDLVSR